MAFILPKLIRFSLGILLAFQVNLMTEDPEVQSLQLHQLLPLRQLKMLVVPLASQSLTYEILASRDFSSPTVIKF
jgi:Na+/H+-dicarboxylate symporter